MRPLTRLLCFLLVLAFVAPVFSGVPIASCTQSGNNTAQATWAVAYPNASTGDLLIAWVAWDDSVTVTDVAEANGPNGETWTETNATPVVAANAGGVASRVKGFYVKATGTWTASTLTFTPTASEQWSAHVCRVAAGQFDDATPIGAIGTLAGTSETDTEASSPSFSAGASDGGGTVMWFAGVNSDGLDTAPSSGWTAVANQDIGAIASGVATRDADVTNNEALAQATWLFLTDFSDAFSSIAVVIRDNGSASGLLLRRRRM
jgi:hypothetical protein